MVDSDNFLLLNRSTSPESLETVFSNFLDKGILENILSQMWVAYNQENVRINAVFMPGDQLFNAGLVARYVLLYKDIIVKIM